MRLALSFAILLTTACSSSMPDDAARASSMAEELTTPAATSAQRRMTITVTNNTRRQTFSPPIVIAHGDDFKLFELGQFAPDALVALAEEGDSHPLREFALSNPDVAAVEIAPASVAPGESISVTVAMKARFERITVAGRLGATNDGFFAIRGWARARESGNGDTVAYAYDAGSEANTELCRDIAGPPCNSAGVRAVVGSEERVLVHSGIHHVGTLSTEYDWRGPVAKLKVASD